MGRKNCHPPWKRSAGLRFPLCWWSKVLFVQHSLVSWLHKNYICVICWTLTSTKKLKVSSLQSAGQRSFARFLSFFFLSFFFFFLVSIFSERDQNKILLSRDISLTFSLHVKVLLTRKVLFVFLNMNRTPITVTVSLDSVELTVLNLHTDHGHLKIASKARC